MSWLELSIGLRYAMVGRGERFVSFSALASALGIMLGVAAIIVVLSVMNGFHINLRERILSASAHVEIQGTGGEPLGDWQALREEMVADEGVLGAAPLIDRQGLITYSDRVYGVLVKGVDPQFEESVTKVETGVDLANLQSGSFKVMLGRKLASKLGVAEGDKVVMMAPTASHTLGGILPRFKTLELIGTISYGVHQFDDVIAYMHIDDVARIFKLDGVDSLRLRIEDVNAAPEYTRRIAQARDVRVYDWTTSNATLFNALAVERRVMFVILSLIVAVAAFQIVAALVTMVKSKRPAIAILRTIGMTPGAIMRIFLIQGTLVGLVGTAMGVGLGLVLAFNVNEVVGFVESVFGVKFFPGEVYFLDSIPSIVLPENVVATAVMAFGLSLLATVVPSRMAARVEPAEVLRYE